MLVIIFNRNCRVFDNQFLKGLASQTVPLDLLIMSQKEHVKKPEDREWLRQKALAEYPNDRYFLLLNSDVIFETEKDVQELVDYLDKTKEYGAIAYFTRRGKNLAPEHVDIACMLIRKELLMQISFIQNPRMHCTCNHIREQAKGLGYKVGYIPDRRLKDYV